MSICFVAGTLGQGGAERQLFYIVRTLRQNGAEVRLLYLRQDGFWENRIKDLGVPVQFVGGSRSRAMRLFRIVSELRKARADIVQSQHFYTNFYVAAAARVLGCVDIGAMRNNGASETRDAGPVGGWLNLHSPTRIAANSHPAIRYAVQAGIAANRLFYLANVVDTSELRPAERPMGAPLRLLAVGRLYEEKRFDRFISVVARLRSEGRNITAAIVGKGPLGPQLETQAAEFGLQPPYFQFKGSIAEMTPVYQESDICVLTSDYEGTPNVLLEAMACGVPVVATNVGGVPQIIRHGENGFMADPGDNEGLYRGLLRLIDNSQLRLQMGGQARAFIEANHSVEALKPKLLDLYRFALPATQALKHAAAANP